MRAYPQPGEPSDEGGARLLLAEDEQPLRLMLAEVLTEEGYRVHAVADGQQALHLALSRHPDLLVIDRGLPGIEGADLVQRLRNRGVRSPALLLTAHASVADRVVGLDAGADDYLVKPFDLTELLARLRALLRRHDDAGQELALGSGRLLVSQHRAVTREGEEIALSPRESALLATLARRPHQVFTRDFLLRSIFETADRGGSVDTYVHYLRRKLGRHVVVTVRGQGYRAGRM